MGNVADAELKVGYVYIVTLLRELLSELGSLSENLLSLPFPPPGTMSSVFLDMNALVHLIYIVKSETVRREKKKNRGYKLCLQSS